MAVDLDQEAYSLKNVFLTLKGGQSGLVNISVKRNPIYVKKKPGQVTVGSNVWMGEDDPDIQVEIYNDSNFAFKDAVPNSPINSLDLTSKSDGPTVSFFQSDFFTKFPASGFVIGGPETALDGESLSTTKFPLIPNVVNPGVNGGYPTFVPDEEDEGG
ncbi:hypothetical protein EON80_15660 [bacterium]|nr:MAG: hypothetical protein EON80_15660 [bacterium]